MKIPKLQIENIEWPVADGDCDRMYMRVNELFDVRLVKTDEGIVVDIFTWESTGDPLASTYAFDQEAIDERAEMFGEDNG